MPIFLNSISKTFEGGHPILHPITLTFQEGITSILIGPSGCGKSTLLRLLIGLIKPSTGQILFDNVELNDTTADALRRKIGYVVQEGGLFPHLTAKENVTLLASYLKYEKTFIQRQMNELCQLLKLSQNTLNLYPLQLSGGERQRVSLMRALMLKPNYLLLDEPLAALDPITRYELQLQLKEVFAYLGETVVMVTHDMREAAYFGKEIFLMRSGSIVQDGSFQDLMQHPAESFVSDFIRAQQPPLESFV